MMDSKTNPANPVQPTTRKRIPMSVPQRKLEIPDMPGFKLHWFIDKNIPRALQAGYEFVDSKEVTVNQFNVATAKSISGNSDMGSHVKVIAGTAEGGGAEHLTLMKIREDWWNEDRKELEARNASVIDAIFGKGQIAGSEQVTPEDKGNRYVREALFKRNIMKGKAS